jgi:hypothetical protein
VNLGAQVKRPASARLEGAVHVLLRAWDVSSRLENRGGSESADSRSYFLSRVKARSRKAVERVYKAQSTEVLEAVVLYWQLFVHTSVRIPPLSTGSVICSAPQVEPMSRSEHFFALLDHLVPNASLLTSIVCDRVEARTRTSSSERHKGAPPNVDLYVPPRTRRG